MVLDIGAAYVKCGFAGEALPRHIVPSGLREMTAGWAPPTKRAAPAAQNNS